MTKPRHVLITGVSRGLGLAMADEFIRLGHTEMLETCFGTGAAAYPAPESWARKAVPFLLELGPQDNGQPLTAPA